MPDSWNLNPSILVAAVQFHAKRKHCVGNPAALILALFWWEHMSRDCVIRTRSSWRWSKSLDVFTLTATCVDSTESQRHDTFTLTAANVLKFTSNSKLTILSTACGAVITPQSGHCDRAQNRKKRAEVNRCHLREQRFGHHTSGKQLGNTCHNCNK